MPVFKIHRLRETAFQQFRWAPHTSGASQVKPKDYEAAGEIEADSAYDAWMVLKESERPLRIGDLLESEGGGLRICKYVGFEEARWFVPDARPAPEPAPAPAEPRSGD
jgi:hypothetical protein